MVAAYMQATTTMTRIMTTELTTTRLRLRSWRDADRPAWAAMNADPEVREFFDRRLTRAEADATMDRFQSDLEERGWGWWAVELAATGELIGMAGLDPTEDDIPIGGVELGWRLARAQWGHGYATEAARAVLAFAFDTLALPEVLAIAAIGNVRSHAVMTRLGMTRLRTFTNPTEPPELAESVIYHIKNPKTI
jgi:RimJ/RimL family protein N-acetyltransferase